MAAGGHSHPWLQEPLGPLLSPGPHPTSVLSQLSASHALCVTHTLRRSHPLGLCSLVALTPLLCHCIHVDTFLHSLTGAPLPVLPLPGSRILAKPLPLSGTQFPLLISTGLTGCWADSLRNSCLLAVLQTWQVRPTSGPLHQLFPWSPELLCPRTVSPQASFQTSALREASHDPRRCLCV